jgi:Protein of unknown function (DUF3703)
MKPDQREGADQLIATEMAAYRTARAANDSVMAWTALERAHIVSQPFLRPHLANHWAMLRFAVAERNGGEVFGQIMRLALAPLGALTGRIPVGNTGRSNVSAFQTMSVPDDLQRAIETAPE